MSDLLREKWHELLQALHVDRALADRALDEIRAHYGSAGRHYHTLDHAWHVLATTEGLAAHTRHASAVYLAAWLHDVIYDSRASDNEERSADYAVRLCERLGIPEGERVAALILATKTHMAGDDPDAQVLLDADLAILGANEAVYMRYADNIRKEYAWVPDDAYRAGRRRVLESFLSRPKLFHFLGDREDAARRNIVAEIARLMPA
jgi:predicted metal-dependent HD superfamily phosphohydrolase